MSAISLSLSLRQNPTEVWDELRHIERHVHWMNDALSITFLTEQRAGVGTTFSCLTKVGPLSTRDVMTVTRWEDGRCMGVAHRGMISGEGVFTLTDEGAGTLMTWEENLHFPWWVGGAVSAAIMAPVLRWIWRKNLANFRAQLDHSA